MAISNSTDHAAPAPHPEHLTDTELGAMPPVGKRAPHEALAVEAATLRCILAVIEQYGVEGIGDLESAECALRCSIERLEALCSPVNNLHTLVEKLQEVAKS